MISWSVVFVELRLLTRSVWPAVLIHTIEDAFVNPLLLGGFVIMAHGKELLISPVIGIVAIIFYLVIGFGLRKLRRQRGAVVEQ
jgi:hypothetical protein